MKNLIFVVAMACVISVSAHAEAIPMSSLSPSQQQAALSIVKSDVRKDMIDHFESKVVGEIKDIITGEPMSAESQAVLIKGIYEAIKFQVEPYGVHVDEEAFGKSVSKVLTWSSKYGLVPTAFTVGGLAHAQYVVGGSLGMEFNFYVDKGDIRVTSYQLYGVEAGVAEQLKLDFYAALCFGSCTGGAGQGLYLGLDGMGSFGLGGNFYVSAQIDITDMMKAAIGESKSYTVKDLYQSKAIYAGFGFDVGEGVGLTGSIFYYDQNIDYVLVPKGKMINASDVSKLKIF